jgi:hypothetical protein
LDEFQSRGWALLATQRQARSDFGFKPPRIHNHGVVVEDAGVVAYERMIGDPEDDRLVLAVSRRGHANDGALIGSAPPMLRLKRPLAAAK